MEGFRGQEHVAHGVSFVWHYRNEKEVIDHQIMSTATNDMILSQ